MAFTPLTNRFALPSSLWLHAGMSHEGGIFRALVGFGHAPVIAYIGGALLLPETRTDGTCRSGRAVVLARYGMNHGLEPQGAVRLACAGTLEIPTVHSYEASYAALALKWVPWGDSYTAFTATDLKTSEYAETRLW